MKKILWGALILLVAAYGLTFLPLDFLQPAIARSMAASLGRRVEIGGVRLTLGNGPGVTLDQVTIHEDPRAGIEPFAFAESVQARLDLFALLGGHIRFSSLRFNDANLNLVKPAASESQTNAGSDAPWNFQMLLMGPPPASLPKQSSGETFETPSLKMRAGRVNLKFAGTKSVIYFDDVDLDVTPQGERGLDLRFSGVPARTDRAVANLEHFFIRGNYQPKTAQLTLKAELEPSPVDAVARLFVRDSFPLKGALSMHAEIAGPPSRLMVNGTLRIDTAAEWRYQGHLNLRDQQLLLENVGAPDAGGNETIRLHVWDLLKVPHWETTLEHASLETFVNLARRLGAPLPAQFSARGRLDGNVAFRDAAGADGQLVLSDTSLEFPPPVAARLEFPPPVAVVNGAADPANSDGAPGEVLPVQIPHAVFPIQHGVLRFGPVAIQLGSTGTRSAAELSGTATSVNSFDVKLLSRGFNLASLDPRMLSFVPALQRIGFSQGSIWRGAVGYQVGATGAEQAGKWTGDYEILNARVALDGVAEPLRVQSAKVSMQSDRVAVTRLMARLGTVALTGDYTWSMADAAQDFHLQSGEVNTQELEHLFTPVLSLANGGFLAKTLRLGTQQATPSWLAQRRIEGTLSLAGITAAGHRLKLDGAHVQWNGPVVRITADRGAAKAPANKIMLDNSPVLGELRIDLTSGTPAYLFTGLLRGLPYKGGKLDLDGTVAASGAGARLLASLRAQGEFRGQNIAFVPDAEFKKASGHFDWRWANPAPSLALTRVEVTQGADTLTGQGTTQADGKLILDLVPASATGSPRVRYTGTFTSAFVRE